MQREEKREETRNEREKEVEEKGKRKEERSEPEEMMMRRINSQKSSTFSNTIFFVQSFKDLMMDYMCNVSNPLSQSKMN